MTVLDQVKKNLDDMQSSAATRGENHQASLIDQKRQLLVKTMDNAFPEYENARNIVADNYNNVVNPLQNSQLGKLVIIW